MELCKPYATPGLSTDTKKLNKYHFSKEKHDRPERRNRMTSKTEGTLAIIVALIVLLSALLSPPFSFVITIVLLTLFSVNKFLQKQK